MDNFGLMHSRIIEKNLQGMAGFAFEEHARFLLRLTEEPRFTFTRKYKDKGIDGYIRTTVKGKKENKTVVEVFSIFGKEAGTQPDEGKIAQDLIRAINYAENRGYLLKKWNLVVNFELETDVRTRLEAACEGQGILFEEMNPTVLVTKINGKEKIFEAACYFNAVEAPSLPYSSYSYHELAKKALIDLANSQNSTTDLKFQLLKEIVSTIQKFSFVDKKSDYSLISVTRNTRIHEDFVFFYKYFEGYVLPAEKTNEEEKGYIYLNDNGHYVIKVMNLGPVLSLCLKLQKQVEKIGTYSIQEALKEIHNSISSFKQKRPKKTSA